ncbi:MAG: hypothetical protein MJE77_21470 [Proteobacteria bacterium]|nr:hypothetical protein [Pseudomonadota bacterium]
MTDQITANRAMTHRKGSASRRSALATAASAVAAMALAAAVAGRGCRVDENTPTGVVRSLARAIQADDRAAFRELLGPRTRAGLDASAARATDLAGGSIRFSPLDMIGLGRSVDFASPTEIAVIERSETRAIVEITVASGRRSQVTLVEFDGHWLIELPAYRALP